MADKVKIDWLTLLQLWDKAWKNRSLGVDPLAFLNTFLQTQGGADRLFEVNEDGKLVPRVWEEPKINWAALEVEYDAHISQRPKDMGKALWLAKFWEDRGGEERYFDMGRFGESVRRVYLLDLPNKIDWDSIHADWSDFWRHRGFAQDQLEGYEEFWKRLGGINRYFDVDDNGVRTQREFKRPN